MLRRERDTSISEIDCLCAHHLCRATVFYASTIRQTVEINAYLREQLRVELCVYMTILCLPQSKGIHSSITGLVGS